MHRLTRMHRFLGPDSLLAPSASTHQFPGGGGGGGVGGFGGRLPVSPPVPSSSEVLDIAVCVSGQFPWFEMV